MIFSALILLNLLLIPLGSTLIWVAMRSPADDSSCKKCGYDLRGSLHSSNQCPECGARPGDPQVAKRRGMANVSWLILGIVLLTITLLCDLFFIGLAVALSNW